MRNGRYVCDVAGPGEGERCGCVKKYIIIGKDYECDISWDLGLMAQCALEGGICLALCYFFPEPASCSDCKCLLAAPATIAAFNNCIKFKYANCGYE